ncbi:MAG: DUF2063 domain-containing protein [Gammaproteobacteria bacterium]|nr:DUF2063 domain-containing protein [Gammaproteobacteria bacterium]
MAVLELETLQHYFLNYMLNGDDKGIMLALADRAGINIAGQLAVYGDGYRLRFLGVLADSFKLTKRLLGEEPFNTLASSYIDTIRSHHFAVDTINRDFTQFLATHDQPLVAEVAHIEWCIDQVLRASTGEILTLAQLQQQAAQGLNDYRIPIHPSLMVLTFHSNAMPLWQAYWLDQPLPKLKQEAEQHWLVWLRELYPTVRPASLAEKKMVALALAGETFSEICQALCDELSEEEAANFAVGRLQQWLDEALLVAE